MDAVRTPSRILLVDDEEALRKMLARALTSFGHEVCTADNGSEALATFQDDPSAFDLVISDFTMPGMSGVELLTECRRLRTDVALILISGYMTGLSSSDASWSVLGKPLSLDALRTAVSTELERFPVSLTQARRDVGGPC